MAGSDEGAFLDLLYSAAARPDLWVEVMERFADMIGGTACWLSRLDQRDGTGSGIIARINPAMPALCTKYYAGRNPFTNLKDPLEALIATAAAVDPERGAGGSMALASPVPALPLSIIVAPLRADDAAVFHARPSVLVSVTDLEAGASLSERKLRELFQFTPAEARLAVALHDK